MQYTVGKDHWMYVYAWQPNTSITVSNSMVHNIQYKVNMNYNL